MRFVIFYCNWSFWKLILRLHTFSSKNSDCSVQVFLCFWRVRFSEAFLQCSKFVSHLLSLYYRALVLLLIVRMISFFLYHWFWSIYISLTLKLLDPIVSLSFVNSNPLALQLNFYPRIWNVISYTLSISETLFSNSSLRLCLVLMGVFPKA